MPGAIYDQELVFEQKGLGNEGTDTILSLIVGRENGSTGLYNTLIPSSFRYNRRAGRANLNLPSACHMSSANAQECLRAVII
jgi:hypothetical protein